MGRYRLSGSHLPGGVGSRSPAGAGLSFEEAEKLFGPGSDYLEIFDDAHSESEDRFIAIGPIARGLILVIWTERDDETLRIISARFATEREQGLYHSYLDERR